MIRDEKRHWYREPYVWLLIAFPLIAVIGGIITMALAIFSNDGLVVDDYYKEGLEINRVLKRDQLASDLAIRPRLQFSPGYERLRLFLSGNPEFAAPDTLLISFMHSTRAGLDQRFSVSRDKNNMYGVELSPMSRGNWYIQIETDEWRLLESITIQ